MIYAQVCRQSLAPVIGSEGAGPAGGALNALRIRLRFAASFGVSPSPSPVGTRQSGTDRQTAAAAYRRMVPVRPSLPFQATG